MDNYLQFLQKTQLFRGIQEAETSDVLKCISYKITQYNSNQTIYNEGDKVNAIGMVIKGVVHIVQDDFWGNRSIIAQILPGNLFGEVFAFSEARPINVSVIAVEDSEIIFFPFTRLITVCNSACEFHNKLIRNLLSIVAQKNFLIIKKLQYLSQRTTRAKLISYLSDECKNQGKQDFIIPFSRQQLADYLLIDRSAMSNELSKMRKESILDFNKKIFRLKGNSISD